MKKCLSHFHVTRGNLLSIHAYVYQNWYKSPGGHRCAYYPGILPDNKVHVAYMGPTWVLSAPGGPHVGPMNLAIRAIIYLSHCISGGDSVPVDEIYRYPIIKWFALTWPIHRVPNVVIPIMATKVTFPIVVMFMFPNYILKPCNGCSAAIHASIRYAHCKIYQLMPTILSG